MTETTGRAPLPGRGETGASTGLVLGLAAVLLGAALLAAAGARVLVAHRMAGSVADLAALAGAVALQHGGDGCAAARRHVDRAEAVTLECRAAGTRVRLVVRVSVGRVLGRELGVEARAHAGPR